MENNTNKPSSPVMRGEEKNLYIRINPQLEGKTDASFPTDFPGVTKSQEMYAQLAGDGWIEVITGYSFSNAAEFEKIIVPLVESHERGYAEKSKALLVSTRKTIALLIEATGSRYQRECLKHGKDSVAATKLAALLSQAQIALYALSAGENNDLPNNASTNNNFGSKTIKECK